MNRGIPYINKEVCKGCGLCIANCPQSILAQANDLNTQGLYYTICTDVNKCIGCGACAVMCPEAAISLDRLAQAG